MERILSGRSNEKNGFGDGMNGKCSEGNGFIGLGVEWSYG